ncbi:MAG: hypothetical protein KBT27_13920 [Prevotellaceae bacterium]|nr:hypothetical protein [Candidatus Faecinaster equi]
MVGITTTREPVRGIIAKQMLEHMTEMAALRKRGAVRLVRPQRKSKIILVKAVNENA